MSSAPHIPGTAHEHTDVNARRLALAGVGLGAVLVLVAGLMLGLYDVLAARQARLSPPPNPLAAAAEPRVPPEPRLQVHPVHDLRELREAERAILDGYGWVDKQAGIVHIPIQRAIDMLAARAGHDEPGVPAP